MLTYQNQQEAPRSDAWRTHDFEGHFFAADCYRNASRFVWADRELAQLWSREGDLYIFAARNRAEKRRRYL